MWLELFVLLRRKGDKWMHFWNILIILIVFEPKFTAENWVEARDRQCVIMQTDNTDGRNVDRLGLWNSSTCPEVPLIARRLKPQKLCTALSQFSTPSFQLIFG